MIVGIENCVLHLLKKLGDGLAVDEMDTNWKKVHAVPDEAAVFQQGLPSGGNADDDITLCC